MSTKRQATTELNHDNWDQDDPADHEEMGSYKTAANDVLEKRVIRTARRRNQLSTGDEAKKSAFSGFGGFNKVQPSSFDFLANLTNGSKPNGSPATKTDSVPSNIFNSKPLGENNSGTSASIFSTSATKPSFRPNMQASPLLAVSSVSNTQTSVFTNSKAEITGADVSSNKPIQNFAKTAPGGFALKTTPNVTQMTSSLFGTTTTAASKSLFSNSTTTPSSSTPFKIQPVSSSATACGFGIKSNDTKPENKSEKECKELTYYSKLKGLNESVSDWIKKHVVETPLCILTPIFKDYERHLNEIQEEYEGNHAQKDDDKAGKNTLISEISTPAKSNSSPFVPASTNSNGTSLFSPKTNIPSLGDKPAGFGIMPPKSNSGFSFGVDTSTTSQAESKSSAPATSFSFAPSPNTSGEKAPAPFSFGIGQNFSFSPNTQKPAESTDQKTENEDEDEPPKVEFVPVVEENSVYEKKCKIFVKKDGNFADKGVGTLYIKKIEDSGKHQLIVRANTNLGSLLLNMILASVIPIQRMGKNNVMLVCIPTSDAKPPPTPVLIRVKTADEADELLETLNKYKA